MTGIVIPPFILNNKSFILERSFLIGEAIKSRGSGAEPYRVDDIVLIANETLGEKWALYNGDPVMEGVLRLN